MDKNVTMNAKDSLSAKLAECFVTIDGRRYNFMQAINVEAKFEKTKNEVPILGRTGSGHKSTGWKGTGSAKFHYNTSIFRQLMLKFKDTGEDIYFEMQIINDDPTSSAGSQSIVLYDCNIDGGILAKFDASSSDPLEEEMDFTYEDFDMPDEFNLLNGMV